MKKVFRHDAIGGKFVRLTLDSKSNVVTIEGNSDAGTFTFAADKSGLIETVVAFLKEIQYETNPCLKYRFSEDGESVTSDECPDLPPGMIVRRIVAVTDFGNVRAGDLGGFLEHYGNLSQIGDSWVGEEAKVGGDVRVSGTSFVGGKAVIVGNVVVSGDARITGDVFADGNAKIYGRASLDGNVRVASDAKLVG